MPVVDRWEPVRTLKNDPQTRRIPIIGLSAHVLDSERETAIATGCDEFDAKPIEFESAPGLRGPRARASACAALAEPGRPGVRKIAARFGVDPGTVQRISRPFEGANAAAA
jgi:CheY-like chemotaxis protein